MVPRFLSVVHLAIGGSGGAPLTARCDLLGYILLNCLYSSGGGRSSTGWKEYLDSKSSAKPLGPEVCPLRTGGGGGGCAESWRPVEERGEGLPLVGGSEEVCVVPLCIRYGGGGGASRVPLRAPEWGAGGAVLRPGGSRDGGGGRLLCRAGSGGGGGGAWLRALALPWFLLSELRLCGSSGGGSPLVTGGGCR